jgi:hypothetical protein
LLAEFESPSSIISINDVISTVIEGAGRELSGLVQGIAAVPVLLLPLLREPLDEERKLLPMLPWM